MKNGNLTPIVIGVTLVASLRVCAGGGASEPQGLRFGNEPNFMG